MVEVVWRVGGLKNNSCLSVASLNNFTECDHSRPVEKQSRAHFFGYLLCGLKESNPGVGWNSTVTSGNIVNFTVIHVIYIPVRQINEKQT
ncbi:MAG: hypothetical protein L0922_05385 [Candidatus Mariimomonas ferrooxydans]